MEVFISWSGSSSERVAVALRDWLPNVIQSVEPFMSASDIEKGSRWSTDIGDHLEKAQYGLICLTQDNLEAPWILFEAGALSKSIESSHVVPYLYGLEETQLQWPLAQFQAALADKDSTLKVVRSINEASGHDGIEPERLERAFETWWPQLGYALENIPKTTGDAPTPRSDRDILEEILGLCRQMSREGTSSLEPNQEMIRRIIGRGSYTEPNDSSEGFDDERLTSVSELHRRLMERIRRQREEERFRNMMEEHHHFRQSPEGQPPSGGDNQNEDQA